MIVRPRTIAKIVAIGLFEHTLEPDGSLWGNGQDQSAYGP